MMANTLDDPVFHNTMDSTLRGLNQRPGCATRVPGVRTTGSYEWTTASRNGNNHQFPQCIMDFDQVRLRQVAK